MPVLTDDDFALPAGNPPKPRRGSRAATVLKTEGIDIRPALTYLEEADLGSRAMTAEIEKFAHHAQALLAGKLEERSIALLIQDNLPKPHGRPYPIDQIIQVLQAAARLTAHFKPEYRPAGKR